MTADAFCDSLEYRICREIVGLRGSEFRELWCDGVIVEAVDATSGNSTLIGRAWMARGSKQTPWRLELLLPTAFHSLDEIEWDKLLRTDDVTGWLTLDEPRKLIRVNRVATYPDRPPLKP